MKPNSPNEMRELDQVFNNYKSCLVLDPNFVPALIGMVCILMVQFIFPFKADVYFRRKNYRMSLEFYQKILLIEPNIVPDVRVPIGICFLKLEMESEAELAFLRALELVYFLSLIHWFL
jgi:RNA polymerase-associated protein CTR9